MCPPDARRSTDDLWNWYHRSLPLYTRGRRLQVLTLPQLTHTEQHYIIKNFFEDVLDDYNIAHQSDSLDASRIDWNRIIAKFIDGAEANRGRYPGM